MKPVGHNARHGVTLSTTGPEQGRYEADHPRAADELRAVLAVSQALAGKLDLEHVLGVAVGVVADIVGAEGSSILLIDPETKGMSFHVAAGPGAEAAKTVRLPPGAGICGHAARTGEPIIVNDAQNDPRLYHKVDRTTGITTRNLLCVPLRCGDKVWGVLEFINRRGPSGFGEHDLRLAQAVGAQLALALENSHLHAEVVRKERMAAVGQTVSGLAHCVKNILNGIRSGSAVVDRCLSAGDFERVRQGWQVVRKNNDMLGNLVLDMLSLSKETGSHPFPTDVNDLAEQVCRLMVERGQERGIQVTCVPAPDLQDVMADPTQLYRCLLNLVSNAVEACRRDGRVRVRVYRAGNRPRFTISVTDDGTGVAPAHRGKLFAEFFTTKGSQGTGLGLPVTKKLITGMGGIITFHSVAERGSRFVIALPVRGGSGRTPSGTPDTGKETRP